MLSLSSHLERHRSEIEANRTNLEQGESYLKSFLELLKLAEQNGASSALFESYDTESRRLASIHWNLNKIMIDTEAINALPAKAGHAQKLLAANNAQAIMNAYICLTDLEATISQIQNTLESNVSLREFASHQSALGVYFEKVHKTLSDLEERMWSTVRSYQDVAVKHPEMLVVVLQIVEVQERIDKQISSSSSKFFVNHLRISFLQVNLSYSISRVIAFIVSLQGNLGFKDIGGPGAFRTWRHR